MCWAPSGSTAPRCRICAGRRKGLLVWVVQQQLGRRHAALSGALFRGQGGDGRPGRAICQRAGALGHRDLDHGARRLHQGHQPLRPSGQAGRCRRGSRSTKRVPTPASPSRSRRRLAAIEPPDADAVGGRRGRSCKVVDTPFGKRPFRVHIDPTAGRRGGRLHSARSRSRRDVAPCRLERPAEAANAGLRTAPSTSGGSAAGCKLPL